MALTKINNAISDLSFRTLEAGTGETIDFNIDSVTEMQLLADGTLHVEGDVVAASTTVSSDIKLKENVENISNALEIVKSINGVDWNWKETGRKSSGVIAQNIQEVMPHLVKEVKFQDARDNHLGVNYDGLIGLLIEAVKELSNQLENK